MSSTGMTKRQKQNLAMGIVFVAVGIAVFAILKSMEGGIVHKDGRQYIYTVDQNEYLITFLISLVGVLIILLTLTEYRWQSRSGESDVNIIDLIRKKKPIPTPKKSKEPLRDNASKRSNKGVEPLPKKEQPPKRAPEPAKQKTPEPAVQRGPKPVNAKGPEPVRGKVTVPIVQKQPQPIVKKEPEAVRKTEPKPVIEKVPEPVALKPAELVKKEEPRPVKPIGPEPVKVLKPEVVQKVEPRPEPVPIIVPPPLPEPVRVNEPKVVQKKEPEPIPVPITAPTTIPEPVQKAEPVPIVKPEPIKLVVAPVKVEALGRCPICGKVILLNQVECVKCGWKVVPGNLVPFG